ncbi:unnamed protein product [Rhizopus stolonifer]
MSVFKKKSYLCITSHRLLPKDPLKRTSIRYFIEYYASKAQSESFKYVLNFKDENNFSDYEKNVNATLERINELLLEQSPSGPHFLGAEYSLADISVAPFVVHWNGFHKLYLKGYHFEAVKKNSSLSEFLDAIVNRTSVKETYIGDENYYTIFSQRYGLPNFK